MNTVGRAIGACALVGLAASVAAVLVPVTADAATGCSAASAVKSFHGYVIVDFRHKASGPDGGQGTMTVTLDPGTGLVRFNKIAL